MWHDSVDNEFKKKPLLFVLENCRVKEIERECE